MHNIHVMPVKGHVASPKCHCAPKADKQEPRVLVHKKDWLGKQIAKLPKGRRVQVEKLAQLIIADNRKAHKVSEDMFQLIASGRMSSKWVLVNKDTLELTCVYMFANRKAARRMKTEKFEIIKKALVLVC